VKTRTGLAVVLAGALLAAACGGGDDDDAGGGGGDGDLPSCPVDELASAAKDGPVELTFWHTMTRANEDALKQLTEEFNGSQDEVKVKLVNNNDSNDQHEKYIAQLDTDPKGLPDLIQSQEYYVQQMADTQSVVPVQSCIDATDDFDADDYVSRTMAYYTIDDVQWGLPFAVSEPVLLYSRSAFTKAGLDPDKPPATFDELRSASEKLKAAGFEAGLALKLDAWHLEQMLAWQGKEFVNNGNGRSGRATEVAFDNATAVDIFTFLKGMVDDGLAVTNPAEGQDGINNLLSIGSRKTGMTIDSSGTLGTIIQVLESGQYAGTDPDVAPVPGLTSDGGVLVGGSGLYISAQSPARQAAAWKFAQFLTTPSAQAKWAAATGFIPVRKSATSEPVLEARWKEIPGFKVAYDEVTEGAENDATAGPAIGNYKAVRDALEKAESSMYLNDLSPEKAIDQAAKDANEAMQSYNDRL